MVPPSLDDLFSDVGPSDPTSDGSGPLPDCSISLYSRPVPFWPSPGKHTYILFEDSAFETTNDPSRGWILEGGPNPPGFLGALTGTLIGYAGPIGQTLKGSNPALPSNREVGTTWTNTSAWAVGISLIGDIDGYNDGPGVPYTFLGSIGYNSNSFTFTLLEEAGLVGYFGNPPFWTPGLGGKRCQGFDKAHRHWNRIERCAGDAIRRRKVSRAKGMPGPTSFLPGYLLFRCYHVLSNR